MQETILILDFGSQFTQLIARRLRELNIYCEIHPYNHSPAITGNVKGVILSGSPCSVREEKALHPDLKNIKGKIPLLGLCYGAQYLAHFYGGEVGKSNSREYGRASLIHIKKSDLLFAEVTESSQVWMSHSDSILKVPEDFEVIAATENIPVAGFKITSEQSYGLQFHPEVQHSLQGSIILKNFAIKICGCSANWTPGSFIEQTVNELKQKLGGDKVILGLSGGVDSSVAAILLHKAVGKNLHCIFVDNGLLRKNEFREVLSCYENMGLNVRGVDAKDGFYEALRDIHDPEEKRKRIGKTFIDVFDKEASLIEGARWLAQGTIYPDVIESVSVNGPSATIKSHHNVGGLPEKMNLKIVEPLRALFKDEVRRVGKDLGMRAEILDRHPFPGPGLAIRILGNITDEKVKLLQEVDFIFIQALKSEGLYAKVWQAGAILLPVKSVGVMGDERTYENVVALRAVSSTDGMTADWSHLPHAFLAQVSNDIINKVPGINRVVYDISSKPPATIEWE